MMGSLSDKLMLLEKQNGNSIISVENKGIVKRRLLITVNVLGSCGAIKYIVKEDDSVATVIGTALKMYARQERLPVLGFDVSKCLLYPCNGKQEALRPDEMIGGAGGGGKFVLCKKQTLVGDADERKTSCWKAFVALLST